METISGQSDLLLTYHRQGEGICITRVEAGGPQAIVPEEIRGVPVTAIGHHAFSPGHRQGEGEQIRVAWTTAGELTVDNAALESLTLPASLRSVGDYAFYNCAALGQVALWGSTLDWGGSVWMNCRSLSAFRIRLTDERAEVLSYLADEMSRELDVTLTYPDGGEARLIFPEYREDYVENSPAHHFDYTIYGPGYPYHHCFRERALDLREYDRLWPGMLAMDHDPESALRLAWYRLRWPRELSAEAEQGYLSYLTRRGEDVLAWLLEHRDTRGLGWFLSRTSLDKAALERACDRARTGGCAEGVALLLEEQHRRFPTGKDKIFDL